MNHFQKQLDYEVLDMKHNTSLLVYNSMHYNIQANKYQTLYLSNNPRHVYPYTSNSYFIDKHDLFWKITYTNGKISSAECCEKHNKPVIRGNGCILFAHNLQNLDHFPFINKKGGHNRDIAVGFATKNTSIIYEGRNRWRNFKQNYDSTNRHDLYWKVLYRKAKLASAEQSC